MRQRMVDENRADRPACLDCNPGEHCAVRTPGERHDQRAGGKLHPIQQRPAQPTRLSHDVGSLISARLGRDSGLSQTRSRVLQPASRSTFSTNLSPCSYWRIFISKPVRRRKVAVRGSLRRWRSTADMRCCDASSRRPMRSITTWPWPSSRDMSA